MKKFIEKVVEELTRNDAGFSKTTIILPGNRPKLFFKKEFQKQIKNRILPRFLSIDEFITQISGLEPVSQIKLWFSAYESYRKITDEPNEFDVFLNWIQALLKDFDDINSALVNPREIFDYLVSAERIKKWGQENLEIGSGQMMGKHLSFWKMAKDLFFQLNEDLLNQNLGYRGLIYRQAVNKLPDYIGQTSEEFVFAGLNALSNAERKIVFELQDSGKARCYWDSDQYYLAGTEQEAGIFLRQYRESSKEWNWEFDAFSKEKSIRVTGVGKRVGQAKYLHGLLSEIPENEISETAVVLADETLLPPVLSSIPGQINRINITMGFPLNKSSMAYFFRSVFELQMNREKLGKGSAYYFKNVIQVLNNTIFKENHGRSRKLSHQIRVGNMIFTKPEFLQNQLEQSIYTPLFEVPDSPESFVKNIGKWIEEQMRNPETETSEIDREYLYRFGELFAQLESELARYFQFVQDFQSLNLFYNRLLQNESLSFVGEPLEGLQILGLLETRLLDFKNVIITSVNDGTLPPGRIENSFIPYDIRREMGMSTYNENDAVFAYHFYRLLQRAEKINLLYNLEADGLDSGEKSRFIRQLEIESPHQVKNEIASAEFIFPEQKSIEIPKTKSVVEALSGWAEKGVSPSSLSSYIRNPVLFYEQKILGVKEFEEAEEIVGARVMGNIIHNTLEELYQPFLGKILVWEDFDELFEKLDGVFEKHFQNEYKNIDFQRGKNYLIYQIAHSFVENVLKNDKDLAAKSELVIHRLEQELSADFELGNHRKVKLNGKIDRIDSVNGTKRIIDYKTGGVREEKLKLTSGKLEKVFTETDFDKAFQLLIYAHLFFANYENQSVQFGIYPLKFPKKGVFILNFDQNSEFTDEIVKLTENNLRGLIEEILDPEIPFIQKTKEPNSF